MAEQRSRWAVLADGAMLWCSGYYLGHHVGSAPPGDYYGPGPTPDQLLGLVILYTLAYATVRAFLASRRIVRRVRSRATRL